MIPAVMLSDVRLLTIAKVLFSLKLHLGHFSN